MADNKRKRRSNLIPMLLAVLAIALIVQAIFMAGDVLFGSLNTDSVKITIGENADSQRSEDIKGQPCHQISMAV